MLVRKQSASVRDGQHNHTESEGGRDRSFPRQRERSRPRQATRPHGPAENSRTTPSHRGPRQSPLRYHRRSRIRLCGAARWFRPSLLPPPHHSTHPVGVVARCAQHLHSHVLRRVCSYQDCEPQPPTSGHPSAMCALGGTSGPLGRNPDRWPVAHHPSPLFCTIRAPPPVASNSVVYRVPVVASL